jgi:hypothetical protein
MTPTRSQVLEAVSRALVERRIRIARRWDTPPERLEERLPAAIEYAWREELENAQAALLALEGLGLVVVPKEALQPFVDAVADADEGTVPDSSAAWESAMAMSVTFGDFRNLARAGGSSRDHAQSTEKARAVDGLADPQGTGERR